MSRSIYLCLASILFLIVIPVFPLFAIDLPSMVILPDEEASDPSQSLLLIWSTEPGISYKLQESDDLENWNTVEGLLAEEQTITVSGNVEEWEAVSDQPWIDITAGSPGEGDGEVTYSVAENTREFQRGGTVRIFGGGLSRDFTVVQEGADAPGPVPGDMVSITGGSFEMGDHFDEGFSGELPVHTVHISDFHMDKYPVTKELWDKVYDWAVDNGYTFDNSGSGQAADHPVHSVNWYNVVKWCNARSEMEGRTPAYYTSFNKTDENIYRTGQVDVQNDWVCWDTGYRLPTEAEWEYAARGGLDGKRFPWGNHNIDHDKANYRARGEEYDYDNGPEGGEWGEFHPKGLETWRTPYTTPINHFESNDYDLYDMAGNVFEWTWDWYSGDEYDRGTVTDPRGPSQGSFRVGRGGSWGLVAYYCRVASRSFFGPDYTCSNFGFRAVLPPGQQ